MKNKLLFFTILIAVYCNAQIPGVNFYEIRSGGLFTSTTISNISTINHMTDNLFCDPIDITFELESFGEYEISGNGFFDFFYGDYYSKSISFPRNSNGQIWLNISFRDNNGLSNEIFSINLYQNIPGFRWRTEISKEQSNGIDIIGDTLYILNPNSTLAYSFFSFTLPETLCGTELQGDYTLILNNRITITNDTWNNTFIKTGDTLDISAPVKSSCNCTSYSNNWFTSKRYILKVLYDDIVSNEKSIEKSAFNIYPNPAKDYLNFELNQRGILSIYNINGDKIMNQEVLPKSKVEIQHLSTGVYYYQVIIEQEIATGSFIKQ